MTKILVGSLSWCQPHQQERAESSIRHFESVLKSIELNPNLDIDFLIVDNDTNHSLILDFFEKNKNIIDIEKFSPGINWAGGRNYIISKFWDNKEYDFVILCDSDHLFIDKMWLTKVANVFETFPEIHAFMCRDRYCDLVDWSNAQVLPQCNVPSKKMNDDISFSLFHEWHGCINVLDRKCIKTIGGYWQGTLSDWGFHDCEYGRRLKKSGLLKYLDNNFISLELDIKDENPTTSETDTIISRQKKVYTHGSAFSAREKEIMNGYLESLFVRFKPTPIGKKWK